MPNASKATKQLSSDKNGEEKPFSEKFIPFIQERGKTGQIFDQELVADTMKRRGASVSYPVSKINSRANLINQNEEKGPIDSAMRLHGDTDIDMQPKINLVKSNHQ